MELNFLKGGRGDFTPVPLMSHRFAFPSFLPQMVGLTSSRLRRRAAFGFVTPAIQLIFDALFPIGLRPKVYWPNSISTGRPPKSALHHYLSNLAFRFATIRSEPSILSRTPSQTMPTAQCCWRWRRGPARPSSLSRFYIVCWRRGAFDEY